MDQTTEHSPTANHWRGELREIFSWIKENAVLCAAAAVVLPGISLFHYTQQERVPVSITSPEMLAALPMVLAVIAMVTVILAAAVLLPLSAMFEGAKRGADGQWHLLPSREGGRRKAALLWLAALTAPGLILAFTATFVHSSSKPGHWPTWIALGSATVIYTWITQWMLPGRKDKRSVESFFSASLMGSFCQMLLMTTAMQLSLRALNSDPAKAWIFLYLVGVTLLLGSVQLFFAAMIETTSKHAGVVKQGCVATATLVAMLCLFPYTGAQLAGYVISGTTSGGADCVQLKLTATSSDFEELMESGTERKTQPLKLLANDRDAYFARKQGEKRGTVYRIPSGIVTALAVCPSPNKQANPKG